MAAVTEIRPCFPSRVAATMASSPRAARIWAIASAAVGAVKDLRRTFDRSSSDLSQGLDPRLGVDLVLRHDRRRRSEAFDDRPHVDADSGAGEQDRVLAHHGVTLERLPDGGDELLQLGRRHCELALLALAAEIGRAHV